MLVCWKTWRNAESERTKRCQTALPVRWQLSSARINILVNVQFMRSEEKRASLAPFEDDIPEESQRAGPSFRVEGADS